MDGTGGGTAVLPTSVAPGLTPSVAVRLEHLIRT